MFKTPSWFTLLKKRLIFLLPNKILYIFNIALIFGLGILLLGMSINFFNYKNYVLNKNDYYRQITFIKKDNSFSEVISKLENETYFSKRTIYNSSFIATKINNENIENLDLKLSFFESSNNDLFLYPEINSGFKIIGDEIKTENEIVITYYYAVMISEILNKSYLDVIGDHILYTNNNELFDFIIVGIFDERTTLLMNYLSYAGSFALTSSQHDIDVSFVTYEYNDFSTLKTIYNKYRPENVIIFSYFDEYLNLNIYTTIFTLIFTVIGLLTIIISFGIIHSSVNSTFLNSLPFLSMLKVIGINDKKIVSFSIFETLLLTLVGYFFAIPISYLINFVINKFVNVDSIFGSIEYNFVNINIESLIITMIFCIIINFLFIVFQTRKVKMMNINNSFIHELGD